LALLLGLLATSPTAARSGVHFGAHDVATIFYIAKSENRNRVDYGLHLDASCHPRTSQPLFPYWRMFEETPVRLETLSIGEPRAYGIAHQHANAPTPQGSWLRVSLRALPSRPIEVLALENSSGRCAAAARMTIHGQMSYLHYVYVHVGSGLIPSIDYIELHGRTVAHEHPIRERVER